MNILLSGLSGFIGQHLAKSLLADGFRLRGLAHGTHPLYFIQEKDNEWHQADLGVPQSLSGIDNGINTVFHLGAISRNDLSKTWDDFEAVNILGTEALLRECEDSGVRRFVFISTVEAAGYGDGVHPRKEEDFPKPENNYGKSKLEAEKIVLNGKWKMECVVVRLPMIYGPGTFMIVPKLFGMVKRGWYPLIGMGQNKMEFCYVENAVAGIRLCGEKPQAAGGLFYVSGQRSYTIREVIQNIADAMECRVRFLKIPKWFAWAGALAWEILAKILPFPPIVSKFSRKPFFTRETVRWTTSDVNIVSTEKIRAQLGYNPPIDIQTGCRRTAEWLKQQGI